MAKKSAHSLTLHSVVKAGGGEGGKSLKTSLVGRKRKGEDLASVPAKKRGRPVGSGRYPTVVTMVADPDPYPESGYGSKRAKITHKSRKKSEISCFEVLDVLF